MSIHDDIKAFYDPVNRWYRCRLDQHTNGSQATLESVVGRYLIYSYMTKHYDNVQSILDTLEMFGDIVPRIIIRDGRTAKELDAKERKKGLWVNERYLEGPCAIRMDAGQGQAPIACIGLYLVNSPLGIDWATKIAKSKYKMTYYGKTVPQGDMLAYWPVPMVGMLEVLALSEISGVDVPFMQRPRIAMSLTKAMPWDDPMHRSLMLWALAEINPKYKKAFGAWIRTRNKELERASVEYLSVQGNIKHENYLRHTLNFLIQNEIRKGL